VIIDCCALILVGIDQVPPLQTRMTFTMARQILVEMAKSFDVSPSRYTGGTGRFSPPRAGSDQRPLQLENRY
jgi:hypothetical protein